MPARAAGGAARGRLIRQKPRAGDTTEQQRSDRLELIIAILLGLVSIGIAYQNTYDVLVFQAVSDDFAAAIDWAAVQNEADPDVYTSPLDSEEYLTVLFGGYEETSAAAAAAVEGGEEANNLSDRLILYTVLMSVSLFLLGIAAVVRQYRVKQLLAISGTVIFVASVVFTAFVPFVGL